ncbi:MAG TPA: TIGR02186 family protein [Anaeromyxobacter sp.]
MTRAPREVAVPSRLVLAVALACALAPAAASPEPFSAVEPTRVAAGSWYAGTTLHVSGSVGESSQVAIRVIGPAEHRAFNRRGKIGGIIWGGVEHVTFEHAPSLYEVFTSAALGTMAPRALREQLHLGYDTLEARMEVHGGRAEKREMIEQLVRLKESEGLYRLAPGAVHLGDVQQGRRAFEVDVPLPSGATPGDVEVTVFELANGAVVGQDEMPVRLERVGMPAFLFQLAHRRSGLFGLLAVLVLVSTGVAVDMLGSRGARRPHPAVVLLTGIARGVDDALLASRHRPRSQDEVERMHAKYRLFRTLLAVNNEVLENLTELEEESSWTSFRTPRVRMGIRAMFDGTADMVGVLNELTANRYFDLTNVVASLRTDVFKFLEKASEREKSALTVGLAQVRSESAAEVGDKALHLARVEADLGLTVPTSFVVTIAAYREFMESGGLAGQLRTILAPARVDAPEDFRRRCEMAQQLVREAEVPAPVAAAIQEAVRQSGFAATDGLAVRSSAAGEGSALSFAGQFESFLNVPPPELADAWKRVVASRYSQRAVFYRRSAGLADVDTPMAVIVQRMVPARASGVLFTRRPDEPKGQVLLVSAAMGLGPDVSTGVASADQLLVSRAAPHGVVERRIAPKRARLVGAEGGGITRVAMGAMEQLRASITDAEAAELAAAALSMERYFGAPQDVEWAIAEDGRLFVLQARTLRVDKPAGERDAVPAGARLLLRGGDPVRHGRAVGRVHVATTPRELEETPAGALLVASQLLPDCVSVLPRVCGVVVERGTVTGHAASLVREFGVPSLFGVPGALETLAPGEVVSLDVASRGVYQGALWPELRGRLPAAALGDRTPGLPDLLAGKLTKLSGAAFVGTWACQSLHDVVRFAHEKAIQAMFDIGDRLLDSAVGRMRSVDCVEPLEIHLVDLGGGVRPEASEKEAVRPDEITSVPFRGIWHGLADPHFFPWRSERPPPSASVLAASMAMSGATQAGAPNYACITESYLNLNSRGGVERDRVRARPRRQAYHYVVVDSFLSENHNENHIRLRFKGGGAAPWQRRLRAEVAAEILRRHGFASMVTGDLTNGWMSGIDRATGAEALATIGHLLRFLARLDMWMTEEADVRRRVEEFEDAEAVARRARERAAASAAPPPPPSPQSASGLEGQRG